MARTVRAFAYMNLTVGRREKQTVSPHRRDFVSDFRA
jgi:hypothetical protein